MPQYRILPKLLLDLISEHLKSKLDGNGVPSKIELRLHLDLILDALISNLAIILARFYVRAGPIFLNLIIWSSFDLSHTNLRPGAGYSTPSPCRPPMSRQSIRPMPLPLASAPHPGQITILMPQAVPLVDQRVLSGLVILPPVGVLPREGGWGVILGKNMFHRNQLVHCLLPPLRRNGHTSLPRRLIPPTYLEINAIQFSICLPAQIRYFNEIDKFAKLSMEIISSSSVV